MKEEIARKWVEELRSGRHRQGRERLKRLNGSMCCLGVLQGVVLGLPVVVGEDAWLSGEALEASGMSTNIGDLPHAAQEIGAYTLAGLNDGAPADMRCRTFPEIADIIEAHWPDL